MTSLHIATGLESFREILENHCYYVDKTSFLVDFLRAYPDKVTLLTRPRRFGKTLTMSMLQEFLDIRNALATEQEKGCVENSAQIIESEQMERIPCRSLFDGLEIMQYPEICSQWMHQYPTVFLSLKNIEGDSYEEALGLCAQQVHFLFTDFDFLAETTQLKAGDRKDFLALMNNEGSSAQLSTSLQIFCRALQAYYGKPAILLIDEYDVPLNCAKLNGYYSKMVSFLRKFLGSALKSNPSLQFAVLSGCLRVAKESIFTGLNNFRCYGISEEKFADKIGFTSAEVDKILADFDLSHKKAEVKEWYDGYRFGLEKEMYCPWDVLQYVDDHRSYPDKAPIMYWNNTGGNDIVKDFLQKYGMKVKTKFETLLSTSGEGILETSLQETLTYDKLYDSEENIWTLLYLTGYLTKAAPVASFPSDTIRLRIPNKEVYKIYVDSVKSWFQEIVQSKSREELLAAFRQGDVDTLSRLLSELLLESISFFDSREDFYHAFLTGLFSAFGYKTVSNRENGLGRSDITVEWEEKSFAVIIEVKVAKSERGMSSMADKALRQIEKKRYSAPFRYCKNILHWGIAFYRKSCIAKVKWEKKS